MGDTGLTKIGKSDVAGGCLKAGTYDIALNFSKLGPDPNLFLTDTYDPSWGAGVHEFAHAYEALKQPQRYHDEYNNNSTPATNFRSQRTGEIRTSRTLTPRELYVIREWQYPILIQFGYTHIPVPVP
jgi:hypothetical protein